MRLHLADAELSEGWHQWHSVTGRPLVWLPTRGLLPVPTEFSQPPLRPKHYLGGVDLDGGRVPPLLQHRREAGREGMNLPCLVQIGELQAFGKLSDIQANGRQRAVLAGRDCRSSHHAAVLPSGASGGGRTARRWEKSRQGDSVPLANGPVAKRCPPAGARLARCWCYASVASRRSLRCRERYRSLPFAWRRRRLAPLMPNPPVLPDRLSTDRAVMLWFSRQPLGPFFEN